MDADRIATLIRRFSVPDSRRGVLGIGLGSAIALLASPSSRAKKPKNRCKRTCGPCEKCRKGKCKTTFAGREACGGKCLPLCPSSPDLALVRNPLTCECCVANGDHGLLSVCLGDLCCSSICTIESCIGIEQGDVCAFDAQCESGSCVLGECA